MDCKRVIQSYSGKPQTVMSILSTQMTKQPHDTSQLFSATQSISCTAVLLCRDVTIALDLLYRYFECRYSTSLQPPDPLIAFEMCTYNNCNYTIIHNTHFLPSEVTVLLSCRKHWMVHQAMHDATSIAIICSVADDWRNNCVAVIQPFCGAPFAQTERKLLAHAH